MFDLIDYFEDNYFQEFLSEEHLVGVYHDSNSPTTFDCGMIFAIDETHIALASVSPNGEANGIRMIKRSKIFRLELDDSYNKELEQKIHDSKTKLQTFQIKNNNILESALDYSKTTYLIEVVLFGSEYCIHGFVQEAKDEYCVIQSTDDNENPEGLNILSLDAITFAAIYIEQEAQTQKTGDGSLS